MLIYCCVTVLWNDPTWTLWWTTHCIQDHTHRPWILRLLIRTLQTTKGIHPRMVIILCRTHIMVCLIHTFRGKSKFREPFASFWTVWRNLSTWRCTQGEHTVQTPSSTNQYCPIFPSQKVQNHSHRWPKLNPMTVDYSKPQVTNDF